ncbi:TetR/AcrR family transcriptional regulator [Paenochrobactrum pullorum]|uniref:TetR/AcrR family transcriptional regulator n=1 Tax=Paenochrobactrum pullorum TaxID=1324351 RepID=UPI0035BC2C74
MTAPKKQETVQKRDPVATSKALLQAAMTEFTQYGFEGGRVDRIAQMAGCNKQLVYHYFGSKADLYKLTLEEVYREIRESEMQLHLEDLPPEEAMARLVGFSFDYLAEHPEFIALLNDENRMGASHLKTSDNIAEMHSPLVKMIDQTLARGIEAGLFNQKFEPVNLYLSIAGLSFFYFSNHKTLSVIFKRDMTSKESIDARRQHVIDLILNALRP